MGRSPSIVARIGEPRTTKDAMSAEDAQLDPAQVSRRNEIHGLGLVAGVLAAVAVGAILWFWLAAGYPVLRYVFIALSLPLSFLAGKLPTVAWLTASARCAACAAEYSVSENKEETFLSATPRRRESIVGRSISGANEGKSLVRKESWTEERYQVVVTRTCNACGDVRQTQSIRTRDTHKVSDDVYRR